MPDADDFDLPFLSAAALISAASGLVDPMESAIVDATRWMMVVSETTFDVSATTYAAVCLGMCLIVASCMSRVSGLLPVAASRSIDR